MIILRVIIAVRVAIKNDDQIHREKFLKKIRKRKDNVKQIYLIWTARPRVSVGRTKVSSYTR